MAVPTADFAATTTWRGIRSKPDFFPTTPALIAPGDAENGDVLQFNSVTNQWEPKPNSPVGAVDWGDIGGTLSDQTDLQAALDGKLNIGPAASGKFQRVTTDTRGIVTSGSNDVINVEDYGMSSSASAADNTTAYNLAVAALTSYSTLYLPGWYNVNFGSLAYIAGLEGVTIMGDGWKSGIYSTATGASGNGIEVDASSQYVKIINFRIQGAATVRGNGVGLRLYSSDSDVSGMWIGGCSDFAIHVAGDGAGGSYSERVSITNNRIKAPLGDGVHAGAVKDILIATNLIVGTGDDAIGLVADDAAFPTVRATVIGNHIYDAGARGIAILEAQSFLVSANYVYTSQLAGIEMDRYLSTTAYCTDGVVSDNKLFDSNQLVGPIGALNVFSCSSVDVSNNAINTPATGSGMSYRDVLNVSITNNKMKGIPAYGIRGYDFGASYVAANQGPLAIKGNVIFDCADYAVYAVADTGTTINNIIVAGNEAYAVSGTATAVFWDRVTTGRIVNNTSLGFAYTAGGTVSGVTTANNN